MARLKNHHHLETLETLTLRFSTYAQPPLYKYFYTEWGVLLKGILKGTITLLLSFVLVITYYNVVYNCVQTKLFQ